MEARVSESLPLLRFPLSNGRQTHKFHAGINLAFVKAIFSKGCSVLIGDLTLHSEAAEWLNTTGQGPGPRVYFQETDVTDWDQLERLFDVYNDKFEGTAPDIVVAGAGIYEASAAGFWDDRDEASHYKLLSFAFYQTDEDCDSKAAAGRQTWCHIARVQHCGAQSLSCLSPICRLKSGSKSLRQVYGPAQRDVQY